MKLEAFNAQSVCGNTKSEMFPIVRESGATPLDTRRVDFFLREPVEGCLEIVEAVNERAALKAVEEAAALLVKEVADPRAEADKWVAAAVQRVRWSLDKLAAVRKENAQRP